MKTLKQQLPYPYNQDLSKILRGLNRRTSFARRRLANDPVTAAYLAAAVRLIQRHLGPGASRTSADPDDDDSIERPVLSFLSQRAVAAEVGRNPPPFHQVGRVSTMRERWKHQSAFVADVLRFGLSASHYYSGVREDEVASAIEQIVRGPDAVRGIHHLSSLVMTRLLNSPMFRLGLIAAAEAEGDSVIATRNPSGAARPGRCGGSLVRTSSNPVACASGRVSRSMTASFCCPRSRTALPCAPWPIRPSARWIVTASLPCLGWVRSR